MIKLIIGYVIGFIFGFFVGVGETAATGQIGLLVMLMLLYVLAELALAITLYVRFVVNKSFFYNPFI
mgnify:CR=1 FL=1